MENEAKNSVADRQESPRPAQEQLSYCCDAPVYFVHEGGPVCKKCGKWAVTKLNVPEAGSGNLARNESE
jgi:hypothetical protein